MSRLQQGISKLNNLSNGGANASGISRLTSPSSIAGSSGNGKNFDDLKVGDFLEFYVVEQVS